MFVYSRVIASSTQQLTSLRRQAAATAMRCLMHLATAEPELLKKGALVVPNHQGSYLNNHLVKEPWGICRFPMTSESPISSLNQLLPSGNLT